MTQRIRNRRPPRIPPFPVKALEAATGAQLLWYALLPAVTGTALTAGSVLLKVAELRHYRPSGWRIVLSAAGLALLLTGSVIGIVILLAKLWFRAGWYGSKAGVPDFRLASMATFILPVAGIVPLMLTIHDSLELRALRRDGRSGPFPISGVQSNAARYGRMYHYSFDVHDDQGRPHRLEIDRDYEADLKVGDSVWIWYLPGNPEYFREIRDNSRRGAIELLP